MRASFRIARIAGIDILVHATFLLLVAVLGVVEYFASDSFLSGAQAVLFLGAVFVSVVLHELGHALTARRFGIGTRDITLLPIGGMARLEREPENPRHELLIALAGPAVSAALFVIFGLLAVVVHGTEPLTAESLASIPLLERLAGINFALAVFNMVPAFPMDGGRVLRAALALRWGAFRATRFAARLGRVLAVAFAGLGLFSSPMLILIGAFVWFAAGRELAAAQARRAYEMPAARDWLGWHPPPAPGAQATIFGAPRPKFVVVRVARRPWYVG